MTTQIRAFLIDMDGVLYEGERPIPGAAETLDWLRSRGIPFLFLTNTSSRPRSALVEKLAGFGIAADPDRILTPPVAAARWLTAHVEDPVVLCVPDATLSDFADLPLADPESGDPVGAVVLGDLGEGWSFSRLNQAFRCLMRQNRPHLVALGMTRYWKAEDGLRLDTGPFVAALEQASGRSAVVLGKPEAPFFETALGLLGASADETCMIGDDLRGDIGGARSAGMRALLVRTGKFQPSDLDQDIRPTAVIDSFADLPAWFSAPG
ncbi:TIGR01458 family HAD-type hydrolase [Imhoffiella purpurea]|uniref:Haloacid dehalogenase-like hydrolase domain-containing protein 2 n=1 Tax=Imhoffiella purpurea TaxID=1249627 RepID=W9V9Y2_9GAMM|nr:TIGR01458 family HAD-type hydrolase [Imhoffiella purpurea]EXJ16264.1 HAD-superfamily subfamily IIA hydrolase, hypothetical 2 [Imhoffiella purpurea]